MLKSRILYLLAVAGAGLLAVGYDDKRMGFTILYALLFLCAFSALSAILAPLCVKVSEGAVQGVVFKDERLTYTVSVRNVGPFIYPAAEYRFYNDEVMIKEGDRPLGSIEPLKEQSREYTVRFPYRGVYALGVESVVVTDMLGLFRRVIRNKTPMSLTVYPESDEGFALSIRNEPQNTVLHRDIFNEDYTSIADVRKYTTADSLRKIHWKLSAKRGELITKTFQSFEPDRTILLLDTVNIDLPPRQRAEFEDKMVSYAASAVDRCVRGRLSARLVYGEPGACEIVLDGSNPIEGVYSLLAGIRFDRIKSPVYDIHQITGPYNMVAFLSDMDEGLHGVLKGLVSFDHKLTIYCFLSKERPMTPRKEALLESLRAYGVEVNLVAVGDLGASSGEGGAA